MILIHIDPREGMKQNAENPKDTYFIKTKPSPAHHSPALSEATFFGALFGKL